MRAIARKKIFVTIMVIILAGSLLQLMTLTVNADYYGCYNYTAVITPGERLDIPISSLFYTVSNYGLSTFTWFSGPSPNPGLYCTSGETLDYMVRRTIGSKNLYFISSVPGTYTIELMFWSDGIANAGTSTITIIVSNVITTEVSDISTTEATLNGKADANNSDTAVSFEYGTDTTYGTTVALEGVPVTGTSPVDVSLPISGLVPNTTYHYRVVGENETGMAYGEDKTFKTLAAPATVTVGEESIAASGVILSGTVNANNADTTVTFEYGLDESYGSAVTAVQSPVTGTEDTSISAVIGGLEQNTTYNYRVKCVNAGGTALSTNYTFTTPYFAVTPTASVPVYYGTIRKDAVITLSSEEGAEIYYTTALNDDTSDIPSTASAHVTNGSIITLPELECGDTLNIKAVAVVPGKGNSLVAEISYNVRPQTVLTLTGITVSDKEYDGNTDATADFTGAGIDGIIGGEPVALTGAPSAAFVTASVGNDKEVEISGYSLTGPDAEYYTLDTTIPTTAKITKKALTLGTIEIADKEYDGTIAATVASIPVVGAIDSDEVYVDISLATAAYDTDMSVGTGRAVTISNIQLTGAAKDNYTAPATGSTLGDINPKTVSVNITIASKKYDGTTTATITDVTLAGIVGTEDVTVDYTTATAAFNNASVGNGKQVTVTGLVLGGINKENYTLPISNAAAGNITTIGKLQSPNIEYTDDIIYMYPNIYSGTRVTLKVDGFSDATIYYKTWVNDYYSYPEMPNTSSSSIKSGEKVQITGNPGEEIRLFAYASQEGYEDSDIGNAMFWILPKPKLSVTGASASDKDYDGNESAVINAGTLSGYIIPTASDVSINASAVSGCFSDKDAGNDKTVTVSGYALTGADAEYYELLPPPTTFTADIRVKEVTVDSIGISSKVYDGSTAADISDITLSWKAAGDDVYVSIPAATAAFTDAGFGNSKNVSVTGLELAGADAANYSLTSTTASTTGIILPTGTVAAPSVNRITDSLLAGTRVTLSTATAEATIHYTLDGSEPTNSDSAYTEPILITGTPGTVITVKAVALKAGMADSAIMTKQYTIAEPGSLIITATPGNQKIALSWDAIPDTVTYSVYNSGDNYLGNGISVTDSVYGYTTVGLTNGTSYTFTVKALDVEARVTNFAQVSAIPRTVPGAPTNVTATAGDGQATISFTESTDNGGDSITGYLVMSTPGNITAAGTGTPITVIGLSNGTTYTFTVCAINSAGNGTESLPSNAVTPNRPSGDNSDGDSNSEDINSGGTTVPPSSSAPIVNPSGNITVAPELDKNTGIAVTKVDTATLTTAFERTEEKSEGKKTVELGIPAVSGAKAYEITLPASVLSSGDTGRQLEIKTDIARVILTGSMLTTEAVADAQNVSLTIAQADISGIDKEIRDQIGGRPVIQLSLKVDGNPYTWSNGNAPVTVNIPYKPTAQELAAPEYITVWYIDSEGRVVEVPSGRYDPATGTVTFSTTHFSNYAVSYVQKTFDDLDSVVWAKKPIEVLASKGILKGTSEKEYDPQTNIKRADFLYFLVRTLGIDAKIDGNFDDISVDAYYQKEIAIAKKLGITNGTGKNKFSPDASITRQDMMVLTERALRMQKKLKELGTASNMEKYADKSLVAAYAVDSVAYVLREGIIVGSDDNIDPLGNTTRAEAAVFLYRIYSKD